MSAKQLLGVCAGLVWVTACNVQSPIDLNDLVGPLDNAIERVDENIDEAVSDPLGTKPSPTIVGGDSEQVYYTTSLSDVTLSFPGPTNDLVLSAALGPSNLYIHTDDGRELVRPLLLGSAFLGLATDGKFVAYISTDDVRTPNAVVAAGTIHEFVDEVIFDPDEEEVEVVPSRLRMENGRVVFLLREIASDLHRMRVHDLVTEVDPIEIVAQRVHAFDLRHDRMALLKRLQDGIDYVVLRELAGGEIVTVAVNLRLVDADRARIFLTDNHVVWAEPTTDGLARVIRYEIATGLTRVWADAVIGVLSGASDDHFVTEELVVRLPRDPNKIKVHRYNANGEHKELADFRADSRAGQAHVLGDRAAWVNDDREIVLAPLAGGARTQFRPF